MPTSKSKNKTIGITLGDPSGIGPEVVAKALLNPAIYKLGPFKIFGDYKIFRHYCARPLRNCTFININNSFPRSWAIAKINKESGRAAMSYLDEAIESLKQKEVISLVTAPVHKEAINLSHRNFKGHTEHLAEAFGIDRPGMMFVAGRMRTIIVTRHLPISQVSKAITARNVFETIQLTDAALKRYFHLPKPTIGVCGLNPHAGEGGHIGRDEIQKIIPAIKQAKKHHIRVQGPFSADTLFSPQIHHSFDAIVAMYHDQGLIPIKTLYFKKVVNMTIGLPFVRTSPAHGTAFDIAGKNKADPSSMIEAIKLAARLSR